MPEDASCSERMEMVLVAHYMTCHCHLGPVEIPREDELEDCPSCGEPYLEDHFNYDCNFAGRTVSMVGCWGSRDWGLVGISVAWLLSFEEFSSCHMGEACSFG